MVIFWVDLPGGFSIPGIYTVLIYARPTYRAIPNFKFFASSWYSEGNSLQASWTMAAKVSGICVVAGTLTGTHTDDTVEKRLKLMLLLSVTGYSLTFIRRRNLIAGQKERGESLPHWNITFSKYIVIASFIRCSRKPNLVTASALRTCWC